MSAGESPSIPTDPNDPLIAQVIADRYRVIRKLGEGGMGAVYLAEHIVIEKKLALKVLAPELARRPDLVARFLQEARSASKIGHENVIDISDFGQSNDGCVYIAMEFLDGKDLGEIVRSVGPLEWGKTREIVLQICRALRAAHDKGIVHRDMKPENIFLIQREGQPHFVKILDFGIAKVMGLDPNGPRLTRTGMIFGTPEYMAPEQAEGKDADHRVDIYAVGCILYHLFTGQTPFLADSFMTMLTKHLMEYPVAPSVRRPDLKITPEMDALVLKALEKDRDHRWQSMADLIEAVLSCQGPGEGGVSKTHAETRQMGGAHSPALSPIPISKAKDTQTAKIPKLSVDDSLVSEERLERPRRQSGNKSFYIAFGLALGIGTAIWFALSKAGPSLPASSPVVPSATVAPPPVAPPAPLPVQPEPAILDNRAGTESLPQEKANDRGKEPEPEGVARNGIRSGKKPKTTPSGLPGHGKTDSIPVQKSIEVSPALPTPKDLKPFPAL
jgi:serine/threonine-protein kinase